MTFRSIIEKRLRALAHSELGLPVVSPIFANTSLKIGFKLFFLTDARKQLLWRTENKSFC